MSYAGEHLRNPVTGEELIFRHMAAESSGELLELDWCFPPGGSVPPHVHPRQEESFEVLSGRARFRVAGRRLTAGAGEHVAVAPGTVHSWRNAGDAETWARIRFRPALRTEELFDDLFAAAQQGRRAGPLQTAVLLDEYREEIRLPWVPARVQDALIGPLASLGRRRRPG